MCQQRVKDWSGDDARCAFPDGLFVIDNWNCATANCLRELFESHGTVVYNDDQKASLLPGENDSYFVLGAWYKNRGQTEGLWMVCDDVAPQPLKLDEAHRIIARHATKPARTRSTGPARD